jgi:hypothetical protein
MQLNPEGMDRFKSHLQNAVRNPCAVCGSGNWQFDDTIFELRQFAGGGLSTGGMIKPVITITCNGCGNIVFMNALTTGVVQVTTQQDPAVAAEAARQENLQPEEVAAVATSDTDGASKAKKSKK